jgi:hypothetical protein
MELEKCVIRIIKILFASVTYLLMSTRWKRQYLRQPKQALFRWLHIWMSLLRGRTPRTSATTLTGILRGYVYTRCDRRCSVYCVNRGSRPFQTHGLVKCCGVFWRPVSYLSHVVYYKWSSTDLMNTCTFKHVYLVRTLNPMYVYLHYKN